MKYAVTFQQRYRFDVHPRIPGVTDHSFMIVEASNGNEARQAMRLATTFDPDAVGDYSFIYPFDDDFQRQIHDFELVQLPYVISPTSCPHCGGNYAFLLDRPGRCQLMIGCICHTSFEDLIEAASSVYETELFD